MKNQEITERETGRGRHFTFFANKECEYFPCHETNGQEPFNCLFCFCPLHFLGKECGGNFTYTEHAVKDCSACLYPHKPESYGDITRRLIRANAEELMSIQRQASVGEKQV
ncbi:MAG: cysteine-rich small domain-containing protein [Clostridium sp.]|jgi:Zn-finger protein|nr:cysteine-rich small domain-containing protein [Clostridium sp.]